MGLFGGGKSDGVKAPQTTAAATPGARPPSPAKPRAASAPTVIGKNASIKGELSSDDDMLIEGRVEGKIRSKKNLIIGETGVVTAQLAGSIVSVHGQVNGDCEATGKVEITSTGKVFGNISAPAIAVAEGATFRGASKMSPRPDSQGSHQRSAPPPKRESEPAASPSKSSSEDDRKRLSSTGSRPVS